MKRFDSDLIKNRCKLLLGFTPSVNFINKSTDKNPIHLTISNKKSKRPKRSFYTFCEQGTTDLSTTSDF